MRHLTTVACLAGAVAAYVAGSATGAVLLVVAGAVLELIFWIRLLRRNERT